MPFFAAATGFFAGKIMRQMDTARNPSVRFADSLRSG